MADTPLMFQEAMEHLVFLNLIQDHEANESTVCLKLHVCHQLLGFLFWSEQAFLMLLMLGMYSISRISFHTYSQLQGISESEIASCP